MHKNINDINNLFKEHAYASNFYRFIDLFISYQNHRVVIYLDSNSPEYIWVSFALIYLKIPQLLLSSKHHSMKQLQYFKNIFNGDLIIDQELLHRLNHNDKINDKIIEFNPRLRSRKNITNHEICFLTSGTSGIPKIVTHNTSSLYYSALGTIEYYNIDNQANWAITLPVHHIAGYMIAYRAIIGSFQFKFINWHELKANEYNFSYYSFVPTQLQDLIKSEQSLINLSKAKCILLGGAKITHSLFKQLQKLNLNISPTYGMSEAGSQIAAINPSLFSSLDELKFKDILPYRKIFLDQNNIVNIKGPTMFQGYFPNLNKMEFFKTSDLAILKDDFYYLQGRSDQIIISGGENISLLEMQNTIENITNDWCFVTALNDSRLGEVPIAFIDINSTFGELQIKRIFQGLSLKHLSPKHIFKIKKPEYKLSNIQLLEIASYKLKNVYCMFHGFMGNIQEWKDLHLKYPEMHLLTIDLPYHHDDFSNETISSFFSRITNEIKNYTNVKVYGYSLGGRLVLEWYLLTKPQNVVEIILESINPGIENKEEKKQRYLEDLSLLSNIQSKDQLIDFLTQWYQSPVWGNLSYDFVIKEKSNGPYQLWHKGLIELSIGIRPSMWEKIDSIQIPITYLTGALDFKYCQISKCLESFNVTTKIIENAAHNLAKHRTLK